jgi:hypothetical protein
MNHPPYVSRSAWGAKSPTGVTPMPDDHLRAYVHHTATNQHGAQGMRDIQAYHMKPKAQNGKGMRDIAYSWVFDKDGLIYQGRGWGVTHGANFGLDNSTSYSFCAMGNFEIEYPSSAMLNSLSHMLNYGIHAGYLSGEIKGHKDELDSSTACPGKNLYAHLPTILGRWTPPAPSVPIVVMEEEEMFLYTAPGEPVFFCDGGVSVGINEPSDVKTFQDNKVKMFKLDDDTFKKFRARYPGA